MTKSDGGAAFPDYLKIGSGYMSAIIPDTITGRDLEDLIDWMEIIKRKAERRVEKAGGATPLTEEGEMLKRSILLWEQFFDALGPATYSGVQAETLEEIAKLRALLTARYAQ